VELVTTFANNLETQAIDRADKCLENFKLLYEVSQMALEKLVKDGSVEMNLFEMFKNSELTGFKVAYKKLLEPFILSAERIESLINEGRMAT